jgi:hypothetical protein
MEPINQVFVDYNMLGYSDIKIFDDIYTERLRYKMGGDEGIHLVVSPEQDPLIQEGVNL